MKIGLAAFFLILSAFLSTSAQSAASVTGRFSSLYFHPESGDLLGFNIIISRRQNVYEVEFQIAEGGPGEPVKVQAKVRGNRVAFKIPAPESGAGSYEGLVRRDGFLVTRGYEYMWVLSGRMPAPRKPFLLKRKQAGGVF